MAEQPQRRYFHLLTDEEIKNLRPVLEVVGENRAAILDRWWQLYTEAFGSARTLAEPQFRELAGQDLDNLVGNLLEGDMDGFEADCRALGYALADRGVPFAEVVASMHLFEESTAEQFRGRLKLMVRAAEMYLTFDKLSHCRMILLAGSYFAGHESAAAVHRRRLESEANKLAGGAGKRSTFHGLVGHSEPMRRLYEQIAAAAGGQGAVFVVGETGVGKELIARAIHEASGLGDRPFVAVNCAALPRELVESELFGHKKGSYTGAHDEAPGLFRAAADGTLLLDEVTEMAPETQAKLLRVLEERLVRPVGAPKEFPVRCRFVASTNRDPEAAIALGVLRRDLFHRLDVHRLEVPPLRERADDVPDLVEHFSALLSARLARPAPPFSAEALAVMQAYPWPGNVRELRNAVEYAVSLAREQPVLPEHLPGTVQRGAKPGGPRPGDPEIPDVHRAEEELIRRALDKTQGNKLQAARMLGISRHRLYDRLRRFKIPVE